MSKSVTMATWDDVPHLSEQDKAELLQSFPEYQRDARSKGVPQLGSGAIYPVSESDFVVDAFDVPHYWKRGYGLDVGWNMTAAVFTAHDAETDCLYVYDEYYRGKAEPASHAAGIRARGDWLTGVIDPASRGRGQADGEQLLQKYRDLGLALIPAANGVEAGLFEVYQRMTTGRLKVFRHCKNWLTEFRLYRRDEKGNVVKRMDHLMDATRYDVVSGLPHHKLAPNYLQRMGHAAGKSHTANSDYDPIEG